MRKHGGTPSRRDKHVTLAAISPPGVARGRFVGGQQSGLAGSKPPPLFTREASSCSSQGRRQGEPWGASPRLSAPTYLPVLSRHRQASWYVPGVIVRKVGQDVYAVRVGDNKILDRDHTQLRPRAPDPSGRPVTFEFTAGDVDSDDEGEDDDFTAERILADKPDPGTLGGRLYKVCWKGFAASRDSWEPPSSFVPRYTTVWMDYLQKKSISLDVKDVLVHLVAAVAP